MKLNKQEQLQEDLFDLSIMYQIIPNKIRCDIPKIEFEKTRKMDIFVDIKENFLTREHCPISAEVYVSDECVERILNDSILLNTINKTPTSLCKNKARIELVGGA